MSVMVVDLMDDLEKGDRSMEHLKKGDTPDGALTFSDLQNAVRRLGNGVGQAIGGGLAGGFSGGTLAGLGQFAAQQNAMNQMANMQAANVNMSVNQMWKNAAGL